MIRFSKVDYITYRVYHNENNNVIVYKPVKMLVYLKENFSPAQNQIYLSVFAL